ERGRVPELAYLRELGHQHGDVGDRALGEPGERRLEQLQLAGRWQPANEHLPVRRAVQRDAATDPVVQLQRRGARDLVEVERVVTRQDREVDGLVEAARELLYDGPALTRDVEASRR